MCSFTIIIVICVVIITIGIGGAHTPRNAHGWSEWVHFVSYCGAEEYQLNRS